MPKNTVLFSKNTYRLFSVIAFTVIFFLVYNTYLVDRSLVNLKIALNKAAQAQTLDDLEKIRPLLKIPLLKEISKITVPNKILVSMELVENITTTAKLESQIEDIRFFLKSIVEEKEKARGGFLSALDRLNSRIITAEVKLSQKELEIKAKDLSAKIKTVKDKNLLQRLYYDLGNVYIQLADIPNAEAVFLKAVHIDPLNPLAIKAKFNLAWGCKSSGEYDKAIAYFEELEKEYQGAELAIMGQYQAADTLYKIAANLYKQGEYEKSRDKYAFISGKYPEFPVANLALFQAGYISFFNLNDGDNAIKYFSELEKRFPNSEITQHVKKEVRKVMSGDFRRRGYTLLKEKKYIEAIESFKTAIEVAPLDGFSFSGMGLGFYWTDEKQEALSKAKESLEISPQDEAALINYLFIYINSAKLDEAIKIGEEALSKWDIKRAEFFYNLGYAFLLKAEIDKAAIQFDRAVKINSDFIFAYNNLGCAFWSIGKYSEAIKKFKEAVSIDTEYADAHFNLGIAYFHLKRYEDAYKAFKKVLDISPDYSQVEDYLSRITGILKYKP